MTTRSASIDLDEEDEMLTAEVDLPTWHRIRAFLAVRRKGLWQIWILALICLANMAYVGLATSNIAATAMIDGLPGWTKESSGRLMATGTVGTALGSLFLGPLTDRFGGRLMLLCGVVVSIGCNGAMTQLSPHILWAMYCVWFINTFLYGSAWGAYSTIIGNWFDKDRLGVVWAIICASWSGSLFFFSFVLGQLLQHDVFGWSGVFIFQACFAAAVLVLLFFCLKLEPHDLALRPNTFQHCEATIPLNQVPQENAETEDSGSSSNSLNKENEELAYIQELSRGQCILHFLSSRHYWLILVAYTCFSLLNEVGNWLPFLLQEVWNLDAGRADTLSSFNGLGALVGLLTIGIFFGGFSWRTVFFLIFVLTSITALSLIVLSVIIESADGALWSVGLLFFLFGFSMTVPYNLPPCIYPIKYGGLKYTASISGVFDGIGNLASILVDFIAGRLADDQWAYLICAAAVCAFVAVVCQTGFHWLDRPQSDPLLFPSRQRPFRDEDA